MWAKCKGGNILSNLCMKCRKFVDSYKFGLELMVKVDIVTSQGT